MKSYIINRKPEELDWNQIPALKIDNCEWLEPVDVEAQAQLCYDDEALYVRLSAKEANIRAQENGPTGSPCEDSCLEFFFAPMEGDIRYFNIEFNPNACMYLGMGVNVQTLVRLIPEDMDELFFPKVNRFEGGWEVSYEIPYSFVRRFFPEFEVKSGKVVRANCFKCAEKTSRSHFITWNPVRGGKLSFHRPDCFGEMEFE